MVKKTVTVLMMLVLVSALALAGQQKVAKVGPRKAITGDEPARISSVQRTSLAKPTAAPGTELTTTYYDYGSNGGPCHNLINYGDGTLSLGRMIAADAGYTTRGTYYAYFDGSTWTSPLRIESVKRGWGNIDQFKDVSGIEVTVAHAGLAVNVDGAKGQGSWTEALTGGTNGTSWPRMATGGGTYVHIIASNTGVKPHYTRSADGGSTFEENDSLIYHGTMTGGDNYDIAAQGSKVGIVIGNQTDLTVLLSSDNGNTWSEQTIWTIHADSGALPYNTTELVPDGGLAAIFDNSGNFHVVSGSYLGIGDSVNTEATYYSLQAPIRHWSEATGWHDIAFPPQDTLIVSGPEAGARNGDIASEPDIAVDASNHLYVVYASTVPILDDSSHYVTHIFALASTDGGTTWGTTHDVTPDAGFSAQFPSMADLVDANLHIVYNASAFAGNSVQGTFAAVPTPVMYLEVPANSLTAVKETGSGIAKKYSLDQNFPNPFNPTTNINYTLANAGNVKLTVYNVLGQEVATLVNGYKNAGSYAAQFNASKVSSGVYFYTLTAGSFTDVKKMVLLK
jgi:hypothetical protein